MTAPSPLRSSLYAGTVMHHRLRPRPHRLRFRVFWTLLDLDEIDRLPKRFRLFSRNRFNAFSFHDCDHGDGSRTPLRLQVERHLDAAGIEIDGGRIALFCMPRIFGYGFNPLSVYFCYGRDGALAAILYEVHNTFGERHSYLFPIAETGRTVIEQECKKAFYVSPFMDMDLTYRFRVAAPDERVTLTIHTGDRDGPMLIAALAGKRRPMTDGTLLRVLASHPLVTLKVIGGIHWHALRMVLKGFGLRQRPRPPAVPVTVVSGPGAPA
jgi:DUF1365 family protein